jgi:predicted NACHT family NTPase
MGVLEAILSYLISLAAGLRGDAIARARQEKLEKAVKKEADALKAISNRQSLAEQLNLVGIQAARLKNQQGVTKAERPLFDLLTDDIFRAGIARWLTVWKPAEKKRAQTQLAQQMTAALKRTGAAEIEIETFKADYFDRIEKALFSDPALSNWRFNLAFNTTLERLDELEAVVRKQGKQTRDKIVKELKKIKTDIAAMMASQARRQAGKFSAEQLEQARRRYREMALESCDIIDLSNLPEDLHTVTRTRELQLRRLYVPLRVRVELEAGIDFDARDLEKIEDMREQMRLSKAGRGEAPKDESENRHAVGERLGRVKRMVILGDPGAGKTTLLRWVATAYLLRLKQDPAFNELPDVKTLPDHDWLPILIRCRDLAGACETGALDDVLNETLRKAHLRDWEAQALQAVMRERLVQGDAVLMIDGLDEIANPRTRARFCEQIERLAMAFPEAPVMVTSRIVGYREMGFKIGRGFEHAAVCEFSKEEKDDFARRWCDVTEMPERSEKAAEELIHAIHSADRIERLTGNPMLLTTMALVKRKVGKLPKKRARLYWEAVQVLLNWRSEVDEPIDEDEALPQLEYIALEMTKQGAQRLRRDEIIALMEDVRREFPNLRPIKKHEPEEFLEMLERRTGIIIEAGEVMHNGRNKPVFEFRHLTFQEYLAALALIEGRFPGRDKQQSLAHYIAPLPGEIEVYDGERAVKDNWREVLRLCVACCNDDDVDNVLMAILAPLETENSEETARPRAILAASCLVDEPNVSDETAQIVLKRFVRQIAESEESMGGNHLRLTVVDLAGSEWEEELRHFLTVEFSNKCLISVQRKI